MICTIKIEYRPDWLDFKFELKKLIEKFGKPTTGNPNNPPLFYVENFRVTTRRRVLFIEGSLARYYNGNNIDMFSWDSVENAINLLSHELGLPLREGIVRRLDVGVNFEVDNEVKSYFSELFHYDHHQRIHKQETTLRFENNSHRFCICFYDKKKEVLRKRQTRSVIDEISVRRFKNLMRIELQIEERLELFLKRKDPVKVSELFSQDFCKLLMKKWLRSYLLIQKKGIPLFPLETKGLVDYEKLMKREFIETNGWEYLDYRLEQLVKQGGIPREDKSRKRTQYKKAMLDKRPFIYQEHTNELTHKVRVMCIEGLKHIFRIEQQIC